MAKCKEPLKLLPLDDLKSVLGGILKAEKAEVDAELAKPRSRADPSV
jgi:hypothetical protein